MRFSLTPLITPAVLLFKPSSQRARRALCALLLAQLALTACASAEGDEGAVSDTYKSSEWDSSYEYDQGEYGQGEYGQGEYGQGEYGQGEYNQDPASAWAGSTSASTSSVEVASNPSDPSSSQGALPDVWLGAACATGCIWSAYAVTSGAQEAGASCEGFLCACVLRDDVSALCAPDSPSAPADAGGVSGEPQTPTSTQGPYGADYSADLGRRIADAAYAQATRRNTVGYCYGAVADAVESVLGAFLYGASAYMAADQLARHPRFFEVSVSDLRALPAGAVVVWGKGTSAHGHISVALGDGREASDHIAPQMVYHYGGAPARVFLPR